MATYALMKASQKFKRKGEKKMKKLKLEGVALIERKNAEVAQETLREKKEKAYSRKKAIRVLLFGLETVLGTVGLYTILVLGSLL